MIAQRTLVGERCRSALTRNAKYKDLLAGLSKLRSHFLQYPLFFPLTLCST